MPFSFFSFSKSEAPTQPTNSNSNSNSNTNSHNNHNNRQDADSSNSNNNNNNQLSLPENLSIVPLYEVDISDGKVKARLSKAVKAAEFLTVQALLGEEIFVAIETLKEKREAGFYEFSRVLRRSRQEALRKTVRKLIHVLLPEMSKVKQQWEQWSSQPIEDYFEVYDSISDTSGLVTLSGARYQLSKTLTSLAGQALVVIDKVGAQSLKTSYRGEVMIQLGSQAEIGRLQGLVKLKELSQTNILNPDKDLIGGKLADAFRQLFALPTLRIGESTILDVIDNFLLALELSKQEEIAAAKDTVAHAEKHFELEVAQNEAKSGYRDIVSNLQYQEREGEDKDVVQAWAHQKMQLSLREDEVQGNLLLQILSTPEYHPNSVGEPCYQQCVEYITQACLVTGELGVIQNVLLELYKKQGSGGGPINRALYERVFKTLWDYYANDQYMTQLKLPSLFEKGVSLHANTWVEDKHGMVRRALNFFSGEAKRKAALEQAQLFSGMTSFSNAIRGDECLAMLIFYLLHEVKGFDYLFHPHRSCYELALKFQKETQRGVEGFGFISTVQKEVVALKKGTQALNQKCEEAEQSTLNERAQREVAEQKCEEAEQKRGEAEQKRGEAEQSAKDEREKREALERELEKLKQQLAKSQREEQQEETTGKPNTSNNKSSFFSPPPRP